ncbi:MAG: ABC transporter permease [Nitrospirae bacterium]|nr:ABC transporter permease [Nitrospirota bacterium]
MTKTPLIRDLSRNKPALLAAGLLSVLILCALLAPWIAPYDPLQIDLDHIKEAPNWDHPFGTDSKGRDIFSRVIHGTRISLTVGLTAALLSTCVGLLFGLSAGYFGGRSDLAFGMVIDIVLAFPTLLLVIGISVLFPPGMGTALIAMTFVGWAAFARLFRGMGYSLKTQPYVEAARASGGGHAHILFRHLFPNCLPLAGIVLMMKVGGFILVEAALSFLGLGVQPPSPSWGSMINLDRIYIHSAPWMVIFPGMAISITVMACNILGDFLRDWFDPKMRV